MSTTIKSAINPESFGIKVVGQSNGQVFFSLTRGSVITLDPVDLLTALRAEGVLDGDDGLRGRVEKLLADLEDTLDVWHADDAAKLLREALNPPAPYQFPTGLGAVVEGEFRGDGVVYKLVLCEREDEPWRATGNWYSEDEARTHFTNLRTLSEGVTL